MRHAVKGRKLGRTTAHREALFRNQLQSLVASERIITTLPKAKELRPLAEKMVTRGKHGTVHARRWVLRWLNKRELVKKVFDEIAPRYSARPGGYLRIVKLGPRLGDGAERAVLEFVDRSEEAAPVKEEAKGKGAAKAAKAKPEPKPKKEAKPKPKKEAKPAAEKQAAKKPARGKKGGEAAPAQPVKKAVRTRRGQES